MYTLELYAAGSPDSHPTVIDVEGDGVVIAEKIEFEDIAYTVTDVTHRVRLEYLNGGHVYMSHVVAKALQISHP